MPISNPVVQTNINFPSPELLETANRDVTVNSATGTQVLPLNAFRRGLTIHNNHFNTVYFDVVSHNNILTFMFSLAPGAFYEMPYPGFHNALYAISSGGNAELLVREIIFPPNLQ
jgi:hypothetical protein